MQQCTLWTSYMNMLAAVSQYLRFFSFIVSAGPMISLFGSSLLLCALKAWTTIMHCLRLRMFITPWHKKRAVIKIYEICYWNNLYLHEGADALEIIWEEVCRVGQVYCSHYHCQVCCLVPCHLEDESLPTFWHNVEQSEHHCIDYSDYRDSRHF